MMRENLSDVIAGMDPLEKAWHVEPTNETRLDRLRWRLYWWIEGRGEWLSARSGWLRPPSRSKRRHSWMDDVAI